MSEPADQPRRAVSQSFAGRRCRAAAVQQTAAVASVGGIVRAVLAPSFADRQPHSVLASGHPPSAAPIMPPTPSPSPQPVHDNGTTSSSPASIGAGLLWIARRDVVVIAQPWCCIVDLLAKTGRRCLQTSIEIGRREPALLLRRILLASPFRPLQVRPYEAHGFGLLFVLPRLPYLSSEPGGPTSASV